MRKIIFHLILITIFNNTNIFTFNTVIHHHVLNYSIYYIHRIVVLLGTDEKKCSNRLVVEIKYKDLKKNEKATKSYPWRYTFLRSSFVLVNVKKKKKQKNVKIDDLLYNNKIYVLLVLLFSNFSTPNKVTTMEYVYLSTNPSIDNLLWFTLSIRMNTFSRPHTHRKSLVLHYNINIAWLICCISKSFTTFISIKEASCWPMDCKCIAWKIEL